jgi:hypothetical protein
MTGAEAAARAITIGARITISPLALLLAPAKDERYQRVKAVVTMRCEGQARKATFGYVDAKSSRAILLSRMLIADITSPIVEPLSPCPRFTLAVTRR